MGNIFTLFNNTDEKNEYLRATSCSELTCFQETFDKVDSASIADSGFLIYLGIP